MLAWLLVMNFSFACDEALIRCDERCKYEWNASGVIVNKKCKCLMELSSQPPVKVPKIGWVMKERPTYYDR